MGDVLIETPPAIRLVAVGAAEDGRGHIGRVLALAEALADAGVAAELQLVRGVLTDFEAARAQSVGLRRVAPGVSPGPRQVVVVDVPDPGPLAATVPAGRLVVIDDGDRFGGQATIVVQPSQEVWSGTGRADRVLAGYAYIPLGAAYRTFRADAAPREDAHAPLRVVACFGGSDPHMVTERIAGALWSGDGWRAEAIVGAAYAGPTDGWPIPVVRDPVDLPRRLAAADLVVVGAGTMKFEVACLGRPAILLAVADDQLPVGPAYAGTGAAIYLGDGRTIEPASVRATVQALADDPGRRRQLGLRAAELIDGRGAERLARAILEAMHAAETAGEASRS